jgi:hypothetical protein
MSMADSLRKGLRFLLMSFGISSPEKKTKPATGEPGARVPGKK